MRVLVILTVSAAALMGCTHNIVPSPAPAPTASPAPSHAVAPPPPPVESSPAAPVAQNARLPEATKPSAQPSPAATAADHSSAPGPEKPKPPPAAKAAKAQTAKGAQPVAPAMPAVAPPSAATATPPPAAQAPPKAQLDLNALEQRLRDTSAIGVFTKLSLKNQVDDLLKSFRGYHAGRQPPTLVDLRQRYDGILLKVVTLLQDDDAPLASAISASRGAIWDRLSNKESFQAITS